MSSIVFSFSRVNGSPVTPRIKFLAGGHSSWLSWRNVLVGWNQSEVPLADLKDHLAEYR